LCMTKHVHEVVFTKVQAGLLFLYFNFSTGAFPAPFKSGPVPTSSANQSESTNPKNWLLQVFLNDSDDTIHRVFNHLYGSYSMFVFAIFCPLCTCLGCFGYTALFMQVWSLSRVPILPPTTFRCAVPVTRIALVSMHTCVCCACGIRWWRVPWV
jgi:hypothetical protein